MIWTIKQLNDPFQSIVFSVVWWLLYEWFTSRQGFDLLATPASKSDQPSKFFIWVLNRGGTPSNLVYLLLWKVMINHTVLDFCLKFSGITPYFRSVVVRRHHGLELTSRIFTSFCHAWVNLAPNKRHSSARWWIQIRREALCREGASISLLGYGGSSFPIYIYIQTNIHTYIT